MNRRMLLGALATAVSGAIVGCANPTQSGQSGAAASPTGAKPSTSGPVNAPTSPGRQFSAPTGIVKVSVPGGTLKALPGTGNHIALTVDDGVSSAVVGAYADLCAATGLRMTFFCNGENRSWTEHAPKLRPLVESGQVFMANHTWSHADLTKSSSAVITEQVRRNEAFLSSTFGVTGRPFLRPPYGRHNASVDAQLADLGYPAVVMWLGSLGDSGVLTPQAILANAKQWFLAQHIVIGHANHPAVMEVMGALVALIQERQLQPVHLGDVFDLAGSNIASPAGKTPTP